MLIDTHSHLYDEAFDADRDEVLLRARQAGVGKMLCPAIDSDSHEALFSLVRSQPGVCYAMMGLHPTSVNDNPRWREELGLVETLLASPPQGIRFVAVGETGLDLYWSKDFLREQTEALWAQAQLALQYDLPLVLHTRDAWEEMCELLAEFRGTALRGVLHSFSGTEEHYLRLKEQGGFLFGIGGPVTYKKSALAQWLPRMEPGDLLLETDSPYLPPTPHRGQRNESAYLSLVCDRVAELLGLSPQEVAGATTRNAERMFQLSNP